MRADVVSDGAAPQQHHTKASEIPITTKLTNTWHTNDSSIMAEKEDKDMTPEERLAWLRERVSFDRL